MTLLVGCSSPEEKSAAYYKSGTELLQEGNYKKAIVEFRNAVKFNDRSVDAWLGLYSAAEKADDLTTAMNAISRVVELDPKRVEAQITLTRYLILGGHFDRALAAINVANELKPNDPDILSLRALILFKLDDRQGARVAASRAIELNPKTVDAYSVLAADKFADGDITATLGFLEAGLKNDPNNLGLLLLKISAYERSKDDVNLEKTFRQIISTESKAAEVRLAFIKFLKDRKKYEEADTEIRQLLKENPSNFSVGMSLVQVLNDWKGIDAARSELETLASTYPEVVDYRLAIAEIDANNGKAQQAIASLKGVIKEDKAAESTQRARLLLATILLKSGETAQAEELVSATLSADPKNVDGLALRANLKIEKGDLPAAIIDIREALGEAPESVALLRNLFRAYQLSGQAELADEALGQAVKASNYEPALTLEYKGYLDKRGKSDRAEIVVADGLRMNPSNRDLLMAMARIHIDKKEWAEAEEIAKQLKEADAPAGVVDDILAAALIGQQRFDESISILRSRQSEAPDSYQPMNNLVVAFLRAGRPAEAEGFLKSVLEANPKSTEAYMLMALVKRSQGETATAEANYRLALESDPDNVSILVELARLQTDEGKYDEAEASITKALQKMPSDLTAILMQATIKERKNQFEEAISIYEKQLATTPDNLLVINNLSSLIADHRTSKEDLDRADKISQRLSGLSSPFFKDTRGWIAYRRGDLREAERLLSEAAAELPQVSLVRYHLGMTYLALKKPDDAQREFKAALQYSAPNDPVKALVEQAMAEAAKTPQAQ